MEQQANDRFSGGGSANALERFFLACENGDPYGARQAADIGADYHAKNATGEHPLHLAVKSGSREMVKFLLDEFMYSPDVRDSFGRTPLHWAAQAGNVQIVETLLLARANVDLEDERGVSPYIYAKTSGVPLIQKLFNIVKK